MEIRLRPFGSKPRGVCEAFWKNVHTNTPLELSTLSRVIEIDSLYKRGSFLITKPNENML